MKPIGDYAGLFAQIDLEAYLRDDPPAVLVQDAAIGSFRPLRTDDPDETLFRSSDSGFDAEVEFGGRPAPLPKQVAYLVFPLLAANEPARARLLVGSAEECDVQIVDASVAPRHAWIERGGGEYRIGDCDAAATITVNGTLLRPGEPRTLAATDELGVGELDLIFLDPAAFYHFVRSLFGS